MTDTRQLWDEVLTKLEAGTNLAATEIQGVMGHILQGGADVEDIKKFLLALKAKGETAEEVAALVSEMYRHSGPIAIMERAVDTVGTGGDGAHTINISTTAAIVAAAAGAKVVKHGNRAVSSRSGASDFLEALGVIPGLDGKGVERTFRELGIGFCFAPVFHPAMRFAAPARKELGVPTVFNILGPLANPAKPQAAAIGVANERMHAVMAEVLATKGCDGFVFRGDDGLDEITLTTTTTVLSIGKNEIKREQIDPQDFGIARAPIEALVGGDAQENAAISRAIFDGQRGAPRDAVLLNAAAAIAAYEGRFDSDIKTRLAEGLERATSAVDSGAAKNLLNRWAALTQEISAS
jgi:anthranilate phosphoribosyltransferase